MHKEHVVTASEVRTGTVSRITVVARDAAHTRRLFEAMYKGHVHIIRVDRKP